MPDLPNTIRLQLKSLMSVKALSIVFKGDKMSKKDQEKMMFELYHGVPDVIMGQIDMLMQPSGVYEVMFEKRYRTLTGSDSQALTLPIDKNIFSLDHDYFLDKHINKQILESRTKTLPSSLVVGRNLHKFASEASTNMKKALAYLAMMSEVDDLTAAGVQYKSGVSEAEVKLMVLQYMYTLLGKTATATAGDDDNDPPEETTDDIINTTNDTNTRPEGWYFNGWFPFCLFGQFVPECDRVKLIEPGGTVDDSNKNNGRKEQRKQKRIADDQLREKDGNNKRGFSIMSKIGIANLEMKAEDLHGQKKDRDLMALNISLTDIQKNLEQLENRAHKFSVTYDKDDPLWKQVAALEQESKEIEDMIKAMVTNQSPPPKRTKFTYHESPEK